MLRTAVASVLGLALACGSPPSPPPDDPPDAAPAGVVICDPAGAAPGACENANDCPAAEDGSGKDAATRCGLACLGSAENTCVSDCIRAETDLTEACADCLAAYVDCVIANCLDECVGGDEAACQACQASRPSVDASCQSSFEACSGLEAAA